MPPQSQAALSEEFVSTVLSLSSSDVASSVGESSASQSRLVHRGLRNVQNTCFLNATLQCLLHCDAFWAYCMRLRSTLAMVDGELALIDQRTGSDGSVQHVDRSHHSTTTSNLLSRDIPITHELTAFAAHFRHATREKTKASTRTSDEVDGPQTNGSDLHNHADDALATAAANEPAAAASQPDEITSTSSSTTVAADSTPAATATNASAASAATPATPASAAGTSAKKPAVKKKKKTKAEQEDAFLDSLVATAIAPTAATVTASTTDAAIDPLEAEERRKAKNKKKRERERAARAKTQPTTSANDETIEDADLTKLSIEEHAVEPPALNEPTPAPISEETPAAPVAPAEPTPSDASLPAASITGGPVSKKAARVSRVEDEEEWTTTPVAGKGKKKSTSTSSAQTKQPKSQAKSTPPSVQSQSSTAATTTTVASLPIGAATNTDPFLPSFPALLRAFQTHRQGQQEDAQELLQILCENLQSEWTEWTRAWRAAEGASLATSPEASSSPAAEDDWNEVGKGSRAIKVVSNLTFAPSPLSKIFCGRVRTQLSVATRTNDTMSFQPFFALHLDIDDEHERAAEEFFGTAVTKTRSRSRATMSVARALDRYMCPSEITGYRKAAASTTTTRAVHMHALDSHALPRILVLHLKRFAQADGGLGGSVGVRSQQLVKNARHVQFNSTLDMPARYLSTASSATGNTTNNVAASRAAHRYTLAGVVVHHGHSMAGGHYTAFVRDRAQEAARRDIDHAETDDSTRNKKNDAARQARVSDDGEEEDDDDDASPATNNRRPAGPTSNAVRAARMAREIWYHCDDARVTPVAAHTVYAQCAYLLFYTLDESNE